MIDKQKLDLVIEYLQKHNAVQYAPYPSYDEEVFWALDMLRLDRNYASNHEKLTGKPIEEMNRREIATMLTFIVRGERFCDGHIASYIESGELLRLMLRLRELTR